jgi:hypothetical protein
MMSDYWIVVTMHPEDPMTGQFDKCFTRFRNSTTYFSPPTPKKHKLQNFYPNATLHHKQFSEPQIDKTQNSATMYRPFPQWHFHITQGSYHHSQGFSSAYHHEEPDSIPDHWMWDLCWTNRQRSMY